MPMTQKPKISHTSPELHTLNLIPQNSASLLIQLIQQNSALFFKDCKVDSINAQKMETKER